MEHLLKVSCSCLNRHPLPDSDEYDAYECGHLGGILIEVSFWDIVELGRMITVAFGSSYKLLKSLVCVTSRIADPNAYDESRQMEVSVDHARRWLADIQELQQSLVGAGRMPDADVAQLLEMIKKKRQEESEIGDSMTGADDSSQDEETQVQWDVAEILNSAAELCEASLSSANPILCVW